jgi:CelD/BcsL family acetyltransferase involved in cellulose biosynthesis
VVLRKDGEPRLIVPTVVTQLFGFPIVRFLGDPLIQYADVLACGDVSQSELTTALSFAADPKIACLALFRRVRDDAKVATVLPSLAREVAVQASPLVDLTLPLVLTARDAREQRRQRRRLAERGELRVRVVRGAEARPWLAEALRLKRDWIAVHGFESLVIGCPEWEEALHDISSAESSQLVAAVLTCGTSLAAVELAFVNSTSWLGFLGAYSPEFAAHGPGLILGAECMQWARDSGLLIFDQLPPSQHYKRRHATHSVTVRDYAMLLTRTGKLPLAMASIIPSLKWTLAKLPEDLRLAVLKLAG